jgi:hypothetical protein
MFVDLQSLNSVKSLENLESVDISLDTSVNKVISLNSIESLENLEFVDMFLDTSVNKVIPFFFTSISIFILVIVYKLLVLV